MLAILSDIHGNLPALQAVVADARAQGCTRYLSLGDVAGYYAEPGACIDLLRELDAPNVLGNHDSYITLDVRLYFAFELLDCVHGVSTQRYG